jgi:hypothetical protein
LAGCKGNGGEGQRGKYEIYLIYVNQKSMMFPEKYGVFISSLIASV